MAFMYKLGPKPTDIIIVTKKLPEIKKSADAEMAVALQAFDAFFNLYFDDATDEDHLRLKARAPSTFVLFTDCDCVLRTIRDFHKSSEKEQLQHLLRVQLANFMARVEKLIASGYQVVLR